MAEPPLIELLDDRRLAGDVEVRCLLGPALGAVLVDHEDLSAAGETIQGLCQTWGGACYRMYAVEDGMTILPPELLDDQRHGGVYVVGGCGLLAAADLQEDHRDISLSENTGVGDFLMSALLAASRTKDWAVSIADVALDDHWSLAYMGVLGSLPQAPLTPHQLQLHGLRQGLAWSDIVDLKIDSPTPSGDDLLRRLRDPRRISSIRLSCALLAISHSGRNSSIHANGSPLPQPFETKSLVGPNLVVVYEPGAVTDLALLWNLRAAHGLPAGLPLAVPVTEDVPTVLRSWLDQHAPSYFGVGGSREPRLISTSVDSTTLESIAAQAPPFAVGDWKSFGRSADDRAERIFNSLSSRRARRGCRRGPRRTAWS